MARRVYFHVGLPKTGTTYLQTILWQNRGRLLESGVLLPGGFPRQHLWASAVVREDPRVARRGPDAPQAWDRIVDDVRAWDGTALITHEFFSGASAEQASRAITALGDAEVHLVVTVRDLLGVVTARWQEFVKNGSTRPIDDFPAEGPADPADEWGWNTMDAADVLFRWGATLPPRRVHVVTVPRGGAPRDLLWRRFASVLEVDPAGYDLSESVANESLGVVEVELLRRVNRRLTGPDMPFNSAYDRGVWIRRHLGLRTLARRDGERFWPSRQRREELRRRGQGIADAIRAGGYQVVGDLDEITVPADLPEHRHPDSVSPGELLDAATWTVAELLGDVRRLSEELRETRHEVEHLQRTRLRARVGGTLARVPALRAARDRLRGRSGQEPPVTASD